jgi:hypothetical protein
VALVGVISTETGSGGSLAAREGKRHCHRHFDLITEERQVSKLTADAAEKSGLTAKAVGIVVLDHF